MKRSLFLLIFTLTLICYLGIGQTTDSTVVVSPNSNTGVFVLLNYNWTKVYAFLVAFGIFIETAVRIFPTTKSYSIVRALVNFLDRIVPDASKSGDTFN